MNTGNFDKPRLRLACVSFASLAAVVLFIGYAIRSSSASQTPVEVPSLPAAFPDHVKDKDWGSDPGGTYSPLSGVIAPGALLRLDLPSIRALEGKCEVLAAEISVNGQPERIQQMQKDRWSDRFPANAPERSIQPEITFLVDYSKLMEAKKTRQYVDLTGEVKVSYPRFMDGSDVPGFLPGSFKNEAVTFPLKQRLFVLGPGDLEPLRNYAKAVKHNRSITEPPMSMVPCYSIALLLLLMAVGCYRRLRELD